MTQQIFTEDQEKLLVLNKSELDDVDRAFSLNALRVLASRYLQKDTNGKIVESPKQLFERVATLVGLADLMHDKYIFSKEPDFMCVIPESDIFWIARRQDNLTVGRFNLNLFHREAMARLFWRNKRHYSLNLSEIIKLIRNGTFDKYGERIQAYYDLMVSKDFLPNTPTLMNAGAPLGQLSACFVLDVQDSLESIMDTAKDVATIFKSGGGVGINYSNIRPEGSVVSSTSGVASGPVSFMGIIDKVTDVVKQGGKRRGANMGIINADHDDVVKFIQAKRIPGVLENFNVSVGLWNDPKTEPLLDIIAESAWASAEPGLIFFDKVNENNPLMKARGKPLRATNPCGEQSLYPYESCNLGSINLANFVIDGEFDSIRFVLTVRICTQFLDNVVDMNKYPLDKIEKAAMETRRIGLGIMGLSDALIKLNLRYDSPEGYKFMEDVACVLTGESMSMSVQIAKERGPFGLFDQSSYHIAIRNSYCTTIAPTGSLSMIADCSSGIEPTFALAFKKTVAVGDYYYKNEYLKTILASMGLDTPTVWKQIANNHGSIQTVNEIPKKVRNIFRTTFDINWREHIKAQSVWQKWINNSISKTINLPNDATVDDVKQAYILAYELGCKGITVYRDGSRKEQVLHA